MQKPDVMADRPRILVYRGDTIESRHRVSFAIANAAGEIVQARGKVDRPVFPRSAVKMLQAIPLVGERCCRSLRPDAERTGAGLRLS